MHVRVTGLTQIRWWVVPIVMGLALVAAAWLVGSYVAGPPKAPDPMGAVMKQLEAKVRASPQNADLRVAVADAYMREHRPADALTQYQEALRIDAKREDALYGSGLAYWKLGQLERAGAALQSVVKMNVSNPAGVLNTRVQGAHYYLGLILREEGRYDAAINELRIALSLNKADADTLLELGKTFVLVGKKSDAASAFDMAVAFVPEFPEAYVQMAKLATAMGDTAKARYAQAMTELLQGKARGAIPTLREVAAQGKTAHYWWGLGYALEKTGDGAGAEAAYKKAVELNPNDLLAAESLRRVQTQGARKTP
ncbi:MAG: tetratricopeptide repeat protein [Chloroflexota bacterium]|nr:tetratricopeptide repeat protein [Chloroflexota bacterium]